MFRRLNLFPWACSLVLLTIPVFLFAQQTQTRAPKYSNEFLQIGVGARGAALGNSLTALTDDVVSGYWNPAGLTLAPERHQIGLMHSEYFAGIAKFDYIGYQTPIDEGKRLGITAIRFGIDDIPNTLNFRDGDVFDYARVTSFSIADLAFIVSYAQSIQLGISTLAFGVNAKVVNRVIGDFATAWGFGLDFGLQYTAGNFRLGVMLADVTSTFNAWSFNTETYEDKFKELGQALPQNSIEITLPSARLGVAYTFMKDKKVTLTPTLDLATFFDGERNVVGSAGRVSFDPRVGLEVGIVNMVYLRGGVMNFQKTPNDEGNRTLSVYPTAGVGFAYKGVQLDYALSNIGDFSQSLYSHLFSLKFSFGKPK